MSCCHSEHGSGTSAAKRTAAKLAICVAAKAIPRADKKLNAEAEEMIRETDVERKRDR